MDKPIELVALVRDDGTVECVPATPDVVTPPTVRATRPGWSLRPAPDWVWDVVNGRWVHPFCHPLGEVNFHRDAFAFVTLPIEDEALDAAFDACNAIIDRWSAEEAAKVSEGGLDVEFRALREPAA